MNKRQRKKYYKKIMNYFVKRWAYIYNFNYNMLMHGEIFERDGVIIDPVNISIPEDLQEISRAQSKLLEE